jgi:hypothetical protein
MKTNREKKAYESIREATSNIKFKHSNECLQHQKSNIVTLKSNNTVDSISRYYGILCNSFEKISGTGINNCFAVRIATLIIDLISNGDFTLTKSGGLKKIFYRLCLEKSLDEHIIDENDDRELFTIYFKQCIHLLRVCGILKKSAGIAVIDENKASFNGLYIKLFRAFWMDAGWEAIFPSDIHAARDLQENKNIIKDLILKHCGKTRLDAIANEFFEMTGFTFQNDLMMMSFLDFYFFTWLKHFNLIQYANDSQYAPVCISVTDSGRKILNSI